MNKLQAIEMKEVKHIMLGFLFFEKHLKIISDEMLKISVHALFQVSMVGPFQ